jgi:hypothetical protein
MHIDAHTDTLIQTSTHTHIHTHNTKHTHHAPPTPPPSSTAHQTHALPLHHCVGGFYDKVAEYSASVNLRHGISFINQKFVYTHYNK